MAPRMRDTPQPSWAVRRSCIRSPRRQVPEAKQAKRVRPDGCMRVGWCLCPLSIRLWSASRRSHGLGPTVHAPGQGRCAVAPAGNRGAGPG